MFAQVEHKRWNSEKHLDGFIPEVFPEDKAKKAFYKNDLRPFEVLNEVDIAKDENTFEDLRQILHSVLEKKRLVKLSH